MEEKKIAIGVDIGGTKILIAAVSDNGEILKSIRIDTHAETSSSVIINNISQEILKLAAAFPNDDIEGVGIGMAGQIQAHTGFVDFAPNLNWHNVPLKTMIEQQCQFQTFITNDVRAATLAEWRFGNGKGLTNFICLFIGTGIGGGIIIDNRLYEGSTNTAGEIGHITVNFQGIKCRCGNIGCMEAYAGGWALANRAQQALKGISAIESNSPLLSFVEKDIAKIKAKDVYKAHDMNDSIATQIIEEAIAALSFGCISLINTFNPSHMIFGGGLIEAQPNIIDKVGKNIHHYALPEARRQLKLEKSLLKDAGAIGAAALVLEKIKN